MLSLLDVAALLLVSTALFGWLNLVAFGLPQAVGVLVLALGASLALMALGAAVPGLAPVAALRDTLEGIDFREAALNGLLAFLLFAGALNVDLARLRERALAVGVLATLGVLAFTGLFGAGFWALARLAGQPVPLAWCLVLGAVVSPPIP